jgi:LmbE family N-acetylglucosaminyl deacetylase
VFTRNFARIFGVLFAMKQHVSAIERAFELAESGTCRGVEAIRRALNHEGYAAVQIMGPSLSKQLREVIANHLEKTPARN